MPPRRRRFPDQGMVLVLMAGFLVLLVLLSQVFLQSARLTSAQARSALARSCTSLSAGSGMEYAAVRLAACPEPLAVKSNEGRGDDWACRDPLGTHPAGLLHPSWSHGEGWMDDPAELVDGDGLDNDGDGVVDEEGEGEGIWTPGEVSFADRDADGRFSAWTGRLRGRGGSGLRFLARVDAASSDGALPVNAGYLDDKGRMDPAIPDYRESGIGSLPFPVHPYHRGLEHVLNNLGVVCGLSTRCERVRAGDSADPDDWIPVSWLGYDLLTNRPEGGYRSRQEIRRTMLSLGYTPAECEAVLPYLEPGHTPVIGESARAQDGDGTDSPPYAPVNLCAAPKPVLTALWMNLTANPPTNGSEEVVLPGEGPDVLKLAFSSRTGSPGRAFNNILLSIFRDEAELLADRLIALREKGAFSWRDLQADFLQRAETLFPRDAADLAATPVARRFWTQAKADLAFQAVTSEPFPWPAIVPSLPNPGDGRSGGLATWASWGIKRDPDAVGIIPFQSISFPRIRRVLYPPNYPATFPAAAPDPWGTPADRFAPYDPSVAGPINKDKRLTFIKPQGGILAAPCRFDVVSCGVSIRERATAVCEGRLAAGEVLHCTCQEDFEYLSGGPHLAAHGIRAVEAPALQPRRVSEPDTFLRYSAGNPAGVPETRTYPHVVSLPRWDRRGFSPTPDQAPYCGFSRNCGALILAPRQTGVQGSMVYWPFKEDPAPDGILNNGGTPSDWFNYPDPRNSESWHELPLASVSSWPPPDAPLGVNAAANDDESLTPCFAGNPSPLLFECPGLENNTGIPAFLEAMTVEAWVRPNPADGDRTLILCQDTLATFIELNVLREDPLNNPGVVGTLYRVKVQSVGNPPEQAEWFIPDDPAAPSEVSWSHHVMLTAQATEEQEEGDGRMIFRLFVDGANHPVTGQAMVLFTEPFPRAVGSKNESMNTKGIDDLRLYGYTVDAVPDSEMDLIGNPEYKWPDPAESKRCFEFGRYVRHGLFRSPRYEIDAQTRVQSCQWIGLVPPGFPVGCIAVRLYGYRDAAGNEAAWTNPMALGPSGLPENLAHLAPVRSLRYEVEFDCAAVPEKEMTDTPVFEGIRFNLSRADRAPRWTEWTCR